MLDSNTAILDSNTLSSSLRFTQKHSSSTLTQTQTYSIWLTWWWQPSWILPSWILPSWIQPFCINLWLQLILLPQSHSFSKHLMMAAIFYSDSWILQTNSIWLKLIHSFTQLDDGSHLEFCHVGFRHCHLGFRHLVIFSQIHSKTLSLHSDSDPN